MNHDDQSNEFHRLPSVTSMTVNQIDSTTTDEANGSFEDEDDDVDIDQTDHQYQSQSSHSLTAHVLYDFNSKHKEPSSFVANEICSFLGHGINGSQYVNATSISTGECVNILENDHGDGWTRIKKLDGSTGFVPSSYLRLDSQFLPTSSYPIESGRF